MPSEEFYKTALLPIPPLPAQTSSYLPAKECSNYHTTALVSHTSKVRLKILQATLQQYVNQELPDVQAGCRIGRGTRDHKLPTSVGSQKKQENFGETPTSASLTTLKL